jgi:imidazole glycerol-phosphate synthase subunit HisF
MLKNRIIPVLTFNGMSLVKTKKFKNPRIVGNPVQSARIYNARRVDELIFLDIFASIQNRKINLNVVREVIKECYMPVSIGGGIKSINDISDLLKIGADKVVIKSQALLDKNFIDKAVSFFGSQCICIAVDAFFSNGSYKIFNNLDIEKTLEEFIEEMNSLNVGEFLISNIENDGMMDGFDLNLVNKVSNLTSIPIVASAGGGNLKHYSDLFLKTKINAVASSSIFHFTQHTPLDIKRELHKFNFPVRI